MFYEKLLIFFVSLHSISATPQINLYFTDEIEENVDESNTTYQRHCLRVSLNFDKYFEDRELILYCLSESPSKFNITNNIPFPKYNFTELAKQNITSHDVCLWLASMNLIERYQAYLDKFPTSKIVLSERDMFFNCTCPRFGPLCQDDRRMRFTEAMYSVKDKWIRDECWSALK